MPKHRKVQKTRGRRKGAKVTRRKRGGAACPVSGLEAYPWSSKECTNAMGNIERVNSAHQAELKALTKLGPTKRRELTRTTF
jgi:hypothetical protein